MIAKTPKITITEIFDTDVNVDFDTKIGSLLPCNTGYGNEPYQIFKDSYLKTFKKSTNNNYKFWHPINNALQYNIDSVFVLRPVKESDYNYSIKISNNTIDQNNKENSKLYNKTLAESLIFNEELTNSSLEIYNRYVENEDSLAISVCSTEENWNQPITSEYLPVIRDINVFTYLEANKLETQNTNYTLKMDAHSIPSGKIFSHRTVANTHLVLDGNLTYMKNNVRLTDATPQNLIKIITSDINSAGIEYNGYREEQISVVDAGGANFVLSLVGDHQYLEVDDQINVKDDLVNYQVVAVTYTDATDITEVEINKLTTIPDSITTDDFLIIQSDTTSIMINTTFTPNYPVTLNYLGEEWNESAILSVVTNGDLYYYNFTSNNWLKNNAFLVDETQYYVQEKNKVYSYDTLVFTEQSVNADQTTKDVAIKVVYDSSIYSNNIISSFNDVMTNKPDFTDSEFALIVMRKNDSGLFSLKETFILKYDKNAEITVYDNSNYIYLKVNESLLDANRVDTYELSVEDLTVQVDTTKDFSNISYFTYEELKNICKVYEDKDRYNIDYLIAFKAITDTSSYNFDIFNAVATKRENTIALNGIWEQSDFLGLNETDATTKLIDLYGNRDQLTTSKIKKFSKYVSMFGNIIYQYDQYNDKYYWVPLTGDIAGSFVENENNSGVGNDRAFLGSKRILFNITDYENKKMLNQNGINPVIYNSIREIVVADSVTMTQDLSDVFRELHKRKQMNKIKNDLRDIFYNQILKIYSEDRKVTLNNTLNNYFYRQFTNGIIEENYTININNIGSNLNVSISFVLNDILRVININLIISNSDIEIQEV